MDEKLNSELKWEIFSRLSVESVIRCKCVSKSWCSILNDPYFVHMHTHKLLLYQNEDHQNNEQLMSFVTGNIVDGLKLFRKMRIVNLFMCSFMKNENIIMESSFGAFFSKYDDKSEVTIVGSCNGLVCLLRGNSHLVLNPITKEIVFIPYDSKINYEKDYCVSDGFGYHPFTKEYKIVSHRKYNDQETNETIKCVQVYTLGSGKWRNVIEMFNYDLDYASMHINGVLYWIGLSSMLIHHYGYNNEPKMLMSFDLATEEYRIVTPLPATLPYDTTPEFKLGEWGRGCLCLIVYYHEMSGSIVEIRVMKKKSTDSDNYSWKRVTVTFIDSNRGAYRYAALSKSGKAFFWHKKDILTCFDPKTNRFASLKTHIQYPECQIIGVQHMKSFVSLKALGEENAERYIGSVRLL